MLQPLLHRLIPYGIAMSYTMSTSWIILFPYALRCSLVCIYADCISSPLFRIFIPALVSRLCFVWHSGHSHSRTARFFTSGFLYPQHEQVWELGYMVGIRMIVLPYHAALYSSISKNFDQDTLAIALASLWLRIIFFTFRSSMQMVWFSRISMIDRF